METTNTFDEESVGGLLNGTEADIGLALTLIDQHLRARLGGWLRRRFPGLSPDDLANTWAETLLAILRAARAGRYKTRRPLLPWLCRIAHARAVDHTRRATTREQALEALGQALACSQTGRQWRGLGPEERREVLQLIRAAIATLPERQQTVFRIFVDHYPETAVMEVLRREVSLVTSHVETLAAVKRALQEGRQKVRVFLRRKGYGLSEGGNP